MLIIVLDTPCVYTYHRNPNIVMEFRNIFFYNLIVRLFLQISQFLYTLIVENKQQNNIFDRKAIRQNFF